MNLTIQVEDVDGDVERDKIEYKLNFSNRENFYLYQNIIYFNPKNPDVGEYYINILVTDNNETPIKYVSQLIKIIARNVFDPPTVKIIEPKNGAIFNETEYITLSCIAEDLDFLINNSFEKLLYTWSSNISGILSNQPSQKYILLEPGTHNITVEVEDIYGLKAIDYIHITVKEDTDSKPKKTKSDDFTWLGIVIFILIVIIMVILFYFIFFYKKQDLTKKDNEPGEKKEIQTKLTQDLHSQQQIKNINQTSYPPSEQIEQQDPQYICQICNAILIDPNHCPYCGWVKKL